MSIRRERDWHEEEEHERQVKKTKKEANILVLVLLFFRDTIWKYDDVLFYLFLHGGNNTKI